MNFRKPALDLLREWESGDRFADELVQETSHRFRLDPRDRSALQRLVYSVIRNDLLLDHWAREFAHGKLDPKTRRLLKMGLAQIVLLDEAPHAAVRETVQLAGRTRGIVNAILRSACRDVASLRSSRDSLPPELRWSVPRFLWDRWVAQHGEKAAEAFCRWNHEPPPVFLRLNPLVSAPEDVLTSPLLEPVDAHPDFRRIEGPVPQKWFGQGWVYAQDPSTQSAVRLLETRPEQRILDACAAPGGKTFAIAAETGNQADLVAADENPRRLERMTENLRRLRVEADVVECDWLRPEPETGRGERRFDRILLDAPCSNTGVIRRRIDVPHRLKPDDFETLADLQGRLLTALAPRLQTGGRLVYSTCSIDHEEGHLVVDRFLRDHPSFDKVEDLYTIPWEDGIDGTYAAALVLRE